MAGLVGLGGFQGTSKVGRGASILSSLADTPSLSGLLGASSLSSLANTSSLSSSAVASSLSSLTLQVFLGQKQGFTDVLLKLVGPLGSYTQYILFSTASK